MSLHRGAFAIKKVSAAANSADNADASKEWELRPGGMLVQKRDPHSDASHAGPLINLKISYGRMSHHVSITANSTFGDLKKLLVQDTRLQPKQQRLLYKGKEKNDVDCLREAGLKDKSKVVLVEDIANSEKRLIELRKIEAATKASKAVTDVQQLVDKLSGQIATIESAVTNGKKWNESELTGLIDLLMCQLLKLDSSKVDGEANVKKRILVRRVQKYVETLDSLILKNNSLKSTTTDASKARSNTAKVYSDTAKAYINTGREQNTTKVYNDTARAYINTDREQNTTKVYNDAAKGYINTARTHTEVQNTASSTVVTTSWENFGANFNTKLATAPVSEPLLIQWD